MLNYYIIEYLFSIISRPIIFFFGFSEFSIRFLSALTGLSLGLFLTLCNENSTKKAINYFFAAICVWFLPVSVWASRQGIPDMLAITLYTLAFMGISKIFKNRFLQYSWPFFLAISFLMKATTLFLLPAFCAIVLLEKPLKKGCSNVLLIILSMVPFIGLTLYLKFTGENLAFFDTHKLLFGFNLSRLVDVFKQALLGIGIWLVPLFLGIVLSWKNQSFNDYKKYCWLLTPLFFFPFFRSTQKEILLLLPGVFVFSTIWLTKFLDDTNNKMRLLNTVIVVCILNVLVIGFLKSSTISTVFPDYKLIASKETAEVLNNNLPSDIGFITCSSRYDEPIYWQLKLLKKREVYWTRIPPQVFRFAKPERMVLLRIPYDGLGLENDNWEKFLKEEYLPEGSQFKLYTFRPEIFRNTKKK